MKKLNSLLFILIITLFISFSEDTPAEPKDNSEFSYEPTKLFPYNIDKKFEFRIDTLDHPWKIF